MDLSIQNTSLVATLTLCGYLISLCAKTPNPNPTKSNVKDRIALVTDTSKPSQFLLLFIFYHCVLILFPNDRTSFCLNADLLNEDLFTWSPTSIAFVVTIFIAAPIRLLAYATLGKNFTFRLNKPKNLVTSGMYAYVQHPSYTTLFLINVASAFFWMRLDGISACYLPSFLVKVKGLNWVAGLAMSVFTTLGLWVRVKDEEGMLKNEFGQYWIEYHRKTKRFIPGIV
ncbi:uncharacterized protein PAC_12294 [Phialocephala subalpina]|uniref:Protein-S-isoprenylcysteine O-methyltransferase n=1 Tax=Phialocephala subalpina TaxID=576137 RepID=A0A1L7XBQ4_9HELO|nr:uncharacterized protein PAC_12294 [Phialocephala subalpina]